MGVVAFATIVIASWTFDWTVLHRHGGMQPSTALCFFLLGCAVLARFRPSGPRLLTASGTIAAALLAYGLLVLASYLTGNTSTSLSWLFPAASPGTPEAVQRMSPISAITFALVALVILLQDRGARTRRYAETLALFTLVLPLLTAVGTLFEYDILYQLVAHSSMSLASSVLFALTIAALILSRPEQPLAQLMLGDSTGAQMIRRLMPLVVALPLVLGWLRWKAQQEGLIDLGFGLALTITISTTIIVTVILVVANWINQVDHARLEAIGSLADNEERLHRVLHLQQSLLQQRHTADDAIPAVLRQVAETLHADGAVLEFREGDQMIYRFASGSLATSVGLRLGVATSLSGRVARDGGSALCLDTESDPRVDAAACRQAGVRSMVLAVLPGPAEPRAVLKAVSGHAHAFREADRVAIQILAATVGASLERISYESELATRTTELERSNTELQRFAYVASHDLQEPLRMVTSYLELIERRYAPKLDADGHEFIRYAVDGAARMKKLIGDLLSFSRIGTRGRSFVVVDPGPVLDRALANLRLLITETGARIERDPLPPVLADAEQLMQVFQNLVSNALKYRGEQPPVVRISARPEGTTVAFAVADNGIGIEEQYFERIFIIFQRLHSDPKISGTGIGLALCKKIVERHGGRIRVESAPGQGSTFHFTLPAARSETGPLSTPPPAT